jgi:predicted nuclease of predicted toxin-antitoxin system
MKLVLDQGLPRSATAILRNFGYDAIHVGDVGMARAADSEILAFAREAEAVVVTLDADFHSLLARDSATRPSVVRLRIEGLRAERLAALVHAVVASCREALVAGAAVTADGQSARVRRLPIV